MEALMNDQVNPDGFCFASGIKSQQTAGAWTSLVTLVWVLFLKESRSINFKEEMNVLIYDGLLRSHNLSEMKSGH